MSHFPIGFRRKEREGGRSACQQGEVMRLIPIVITVLTLISPVAFGAEEESPGQRTVTLITGDQVVVDSALPPKLNMQAGKGREHISFTTHSVPYAGGSKQHLYVIPDDAIPLLASGLLDKELFNVTALLDSHYDDQHRPDLPLILTYKSQSSARIAARATLAGLSQARALAVVNAVAARASVEDMGRLWNALVDSSTAVSSAVRDDEIKKVWLDAALKPVLDRSVPQIRAPEAWAAGYEGTGVSVAVADSGIDATHPDLAGKVIAQRNFTGEPDRDEDGHGTHVASIIAGSGAASGGQYRGVAPGAQLIVAKVCEISGCPISSIISGIEWAVTEQGAKIVNLSLGTTDTSGIDPLEEAINQLTASHGALFVVAAGNEGPGASTVSSPASADAALAVAAVSRTNQTASFSSRGPRAGDEAVKPEISAPGVGIVAARASGTDLGTPVNERYTALSGTSMATPHVAGAAALLIQRHPNWRAAELKAALMGSAQLSQAVPVFEQGAGRVDVGAAFTAVVTAQPASVSFGTTLWPHDDDPILTREVTFRNISDAATTLTFHFEAAGAPQGMFTVSPASLTIPAGGSASASIMANTRIGAIDGALSSRLIATASGGRVSLPVAVTREAESYDLTLRHLGREGTPVFFSTLVERTDKLVSTDGFYAGVGEVTFRLPKGRYAIRSSMPVGSAGGLPVLMRPAFSLNATETLTFDAREVQVIQLTPPTATSIPFFVQLITYVQTDFGIPLQINTTRTASSTPFATATLGEASSLSSYLTVQWSDPVTPQGPAREAESLYSAAWFKQGGLIAGGTKSLPRDELAVVRSHFTTAFAEIVEGSVLVAVNHPSSYVGSRSIPIPSNRTEYYYSEGGVRWETTLIPRASQYVKLGSAANQYLAGRRYTQSWNEPPFVPAFPDDGNPRWVTRTGNELSVFLPPYGDKEGHAGFIAPNAHLELYRNGQKIDEGEGSVAKFQVPAELSTYRLEASATQSVYALSSRMHGAWTFDSEGASGTGRQQMPLLWMLIRPNLNERGQALRGATVLIPLSVHQLGTFASPDVSAVTVQASFDDGASWQEMSVNRDGKNWAVEMKHPKQGDYVSLRMSAQGTGNNRVEETIMRAYGLTEQ
jgi:hypothetical protein